MKQMSFKMRIAVFTGIIVLVTSLALTLLSMYNAKKQIDLVVSLKPPEGSEVRYSAEQSSNVTYNIVSENLASEEVKDTENTAPEEITDTDSADAEISFQTYTVSADNASRRFNIFSLVSMLVIAAAGMLSAYLFAGKSLKPIRELNTAALSITEDNLDMRLPKRDTRDEISSLTDSFNSMLDRLSDAFEQQKLFSANAAHEFKTPVSIIKTGLQTLKLDEKADIEDYRETFEVISRNSKRLSDIVDDLLTLTNKNASFTFETISVNSMLIDITRDLTPKYRIKEVNVIYDFKNEVFLRCPETLTCRLFTNLIENAFKYNKTKGNIVISAEGSGEECTVSIQDSGIGIAKEHMPYIWNSFYCTDSSRSKKLGGTGLGLSLAKEIAERLGWEIKASSVFGKGSKFTVKCKNTDG